MAHLELQSVSKHFGGVRALDDVSLTVTWARPRDRRRERRGQVDARPDSRRRSLCGRRSDAPRRSADLLPLAARGARSRRRGDRPGAVARSTAHSRRERVPRRRAEAQRLHPPRPSVGHTRIWRPRRASTFRPRARREPENGRAAESRDPAGLSRDARIIVMDEPSAALSAPETAQLHEIVRSLAARQRTIVLISHFLREVLELADTVTVLRDGRVIRTSPTPRRPRRRSWRDARPSPDDDVSAEAASGGSRSSCSPSRTSKRLESRTRRSRCALERSWASPASSVRAELSSRARSSARTASSKEAPGSAQATSSAEALEGASTLVSR